MAARTVVSSSKHSSSEGSRTTGSKFRDIWLGKRLATSTALEYFLFNHPVDDVVDKCDAPDREKGKRKDKIQAQGLDLDAGRAYSKYRYKEAKEKRRQAINRRGVEDLAEDVLAPASANTARGSSRAHTPAGSDVSGDELWVPASRPTSAQSPQAARAMKAGSLDRQSPVTARHLGADLLSPELQRAASKAEPGSPGQRRTMKTSISIPNVAPVNPVLHRRGMKSSSSIPNVAMSHTSAPSVKSEAKTAKSRKSRDKSPLRGVKNAGKGDEDESIDFDDDRVVKATTKRATYSLALVTQVSLLLVLFVCAGLIIASTALVSTSLAEDTVVELLDRKSQSVQFVTSEFSQRALSIGEYFSAIYDVRLSIETSQGQNQTLSWLLQHFIPNYIGAAKGVYVGNADGQFVGVFDENPGELTLASPSSTSQDLVTLSSYNLKTKKTGEQVQFPYDLTSRPWWIEGTATKFPRFSSPYVFIRAEQGVGVTLTIPFPATATQPLTVIGVDLLYSQLRDAYAAMASVDDLVLFAVADNGEVIASNSPASTVDRDGNLILLSSSSNEIMRGTGKAYLEKFGEYRLIPSPQFLRTELGDGTAIVIMARQMSSARASTQGVVFVAALESNLTDDTFSHSLSPDVILSIALLVLLAMLIARIVATITRPLERVAVVVERFNTTEGKLDKQHLRNITLSTVFSVETASLANELWRHMNFLCRRAAYIPSGLPTEATTDIPTPRQHSMGITCLHMSPEGGWEDYSPSALSLALSIITTEITVLVKYFNGTVDHTMKSSGNIIVYFGGLEAMSAAALRCLFLALACRRRLEQVNARVLAPRGLPQFQMSAGVATKKDEFGPILPEAVRVGPSGDLVRTAEMLAGEARALAVASQVDPEPGAAVLAGAVCIQAKTVVYIARKNPPNLKVGRHSVSQGEDSLDPLRSVADEASLFGEVLRPSIADMGYCVSYLKQHGLLPTFAKSVHKIYFELDPTVQHLFQGNKDDMQGIILKSVGAVASQLGDIKKLYKMLVELGHRHVSYGTKPQHYPGMVKSFGLAIQSILVQSPEMDGRPTEAQVQNFITFWNAVGDVMVCGVTQGRQVFSLNERDVSDPPTDWSQVLKLTDTDASPLASAAPSSVSLE